MSESKSPRDFQILYYEADKWNMIELHKSACGSYCSAAGSFNYDILHECQTVRDLLRQYGIITVVADGRHIILNRGNAVEKLQVLVASQEKAFDAYCLQHDDVKKTFYLPDHLG